MLAACLLFKHRCVQDASSTKHESWVTLMMQCRRNMQGRQFGPYPVDKSQTFAETKLSFAFVNLKPVVPGHVLVSPDRVVQSFEDLEPGEVADLW